MHKILAFTTLLTLSGINSFACENDQDLAEVHKQLKGIGYDLRIDKNGEAWSLVLCEQNAVNDDVLSVVKYLPHLKELNLIYTPIKGNGLKHVAKLKKLERLDLYGTLVNEDSFVHIAEISSLKYVNLHTIASNEAGKMINGKPKVTDNGLAKFAKLKNLETLLISGMSTEYGVEKLSPLKHLKRLELGSTAITCYSIERLKKLFPDVEFD